MSINNDPNCKLNQLIITSNVGMKASRKISRTIEQKIECLRKAISNSKKHIQAGDPRRIYSQYIRYALDEFVYLNICTSTEAKAKGLKRKDVIHEHVIPHSIVMNKLLELDPLTDENIMSVLNKYYIICIITKEEDKRLNAAGLRRNMPPEWNEENGSVFARYEHDKVQLSILKNQ